MELRSDFDHIAPEILAARHPGTCFRSTLFVSFLPQNHHWLTPQAPSGEIPTLRRDISHSSVIFSALQNATFDVNDSLSVA
jgi:hypothetical protein